MDNFKLEAIDFTLICPDFWTLPPLGKKFTFTCYEPPLPGCSHAAIAFLVFHLKDLT